jgi:hypothetical protein
MTRLYHVEAVNDRTGNRVRLTAVPCSHGEACILKSKFNPHQHVRIVLVPA